MDKCNKKQLCVRQLAPAISIAGVEHGEFKNFQLKDYRGKYLLVLFFPAAFSGVCPAELQAFSDHAVEFRNVGCEILGCSTDSQYTLCAWMQQPRKQGGLGDLDFPILADKSMNIARQYGVLDEGTGFAERASFIIDRQGLVRQITVNDRTIARSVDETLRLVQAVQFTDEFGQVCPAYWKPRRKS